jgi:NAD/NADP transhydrogenase alpha subunit
MTALFNPPKGGAAIQQQQLEMQKKQQAKLDAQEIEKQRQMAAMASARSSGGYRQLMSGGDTGQTDLGLSNSTTLGIGS